MPAATTRDDNGCRFYSIPIGINFAGYANLLIQNREVAFAPAAIVVMLPSSAIADVAWLEPGEIYIRITLEAAAYHVDIAVGAVFHMACM
ncbi:hypothetical protein HMPREF2692_04795 [Corynebacterium sp. HMSC036D03]|nr:hypothetical protein HMPREF2692_04795 [Corynebacterium sp. HMSC036D03]